MEIRKNILRTIKTARYYSLGNLKSSKRLYVLHGYGQLAEYFIKKFQPLAEQNCRIIAPEGLHRFYVNGLSGRVGASWMTKEDRSNDIQDYLTFLNQIHGICEAEHPAENIVLGFSQGVATAFRWLENGHISTKHLLMCSGMIPPEIQISRSNPIWKNMKLTYISGDEDSFKDNPEVQKFKSELEKLPIRVQSIEFKGGHSIDIASVIKALEV